MPKVSVIMPVYNVEAYLAECLDSVRQQTFQDIEIICIDDASTDHSMDILQEFAHKDTRITILQNNRNQRQAFARNKGMDRACGEYVLFVDSDDYIERDLVEKTLAVADGVDMVCFDYKKVDSVWFGKDEHLFLLDKGKYSAHDYFRQSVDRNSIVYSPCTKLYRRSFLLRENIRFMDGLLYEDVVFDFLCMMNAREIYCITDKLYEYRIRKNSSMTKGIDGQNVSAYFYIVCYLAQYYLEHHFDAGMETAVEKYIQAMYRCFINTYRRYSAKKDGYLLKNDMNVEKYAKLYGIVAGYESHYGLIQLHIVEQLETIRKAARILVYGAGDVAREVIETLNRYDIAVDKIVVSEKKGNRNSILGNRVYEITECIGEREDSLVILATDARFYPEIEKTLLKFGFKDYVEVW